MTLLKQAIRKSVELFEKERAEGRYSWQLLFHAYKLSKYQDDKVANKMLSDYYWFALKDVLEQVTKRPIMGRKSRKTTTRFRRIGSTHTYEPSTLKDPYKEDVKKAYLSRRQEVFIELVNWMNNEATPTIFTQLKENNNDYEEDRRRRAARLNMPGTISVLSSDYEQ